MSAITIDWTAIRIFNKVWEPIAEKLEEAERCDAGFDGGEFSGPAHANLELEAYTRTVDSVAARLGMDAGILYVQLQEAQYVTLDHFMHHRNLKRIK